MRVERFSTPGPLTVEVRVPAGRVELETTDGEETVVELRPLRDNAASREAVEQATVELREEAGGRRVTVDVGRKTMFGITFEVNREVGVRVVAPHGFAADVSVASADVDGRGRIGSAKIKTASGDVGLERVERDVELKSASGDLAVTRAGGAAEIQSASGDVALLDVGGPAKVRTASGDVFVRAAATDVTVNTASGDQRVEAVAAGRVELKSASGDLWVGVRQGSRVWVDARSLSGDTSSELDLDAAPEEADDGPLVEISATSMSGDVRIARAAPEARTA